MKSAERASRKKKEPDTKSISIPTILNPAYLVLPETDYAIKRGLTSRKLENGLPVIYQSDAGWHNPTVFPVLIQLPDGTKVLGYQTISEMNRNASPALTRETGDRGEAADTEVNNDARSAGEESRRNLAAETLYSGELTPKDILHCKTVLLAIAGYEILDRTNKPQLPTGYKPMEAVLASALTEKLAAILQLKIRTDGDEKDLLTSVKNLNAHPEFFTLLNSLLATEPVQSIFRVNNCDTPHIPVLNPETPDWILKIWYFLVNHPKHTTYCRSRKTLFDKTLYERWRRLVKLEPQTLVTLFFTAVGVRSALIDKLLNQPAGSCEETVAQYFQQETALNIFKDWKVTHIAGLSYTFAQICELSPFAHKIDLLQKQEEKQVTINDVSPAKLLLLTQFFKQALNAVAENNSPIGKTASFNNLVRKFFAGRVSIAYLQELLREVWGIRPGFNDSDVLCAPDIIWVARGIELTKNGEAR